MSNSRFALAVTLLLGGCLGVYEPFEGADLCAEIDLTCSGDERCTPVDENADGLVDALACIPSEGAVDPGGECNYSADTFEDDCLAPDACFVYEAWAPFGVCAPICDAETECPLDDQACLQPGDAPAGHCVITCDPLGETCSEFHECHPISFDGAVRFVCLPRTVDDAELYRACSRQVDCGPGMACTGAESFSAGQCGAANCCAPYCSTAMGADPCPDDGACTSMDLAGWPSEDLGPDSGLCLYP